MPEIKRCGIEGCCVSSNFYDLGGAHSKYRSKDIEEFAGKLLTLGYTNFNIAITNSQQTTERKYLEELGFKQIWASRHHEASEAERIWLHAADHVTLDERLGAYRERVKQKEEEKKKKALEEAKKKAESDIKDMTVYFHDSFKELPEKVNAAQVTEWLERFPHAEVDTICKAFLGNSFEMTGFARRWSYPGEISRGFNARLSTLHKRKAGSHGT